MTRIAYRFEIIARERLSEVEVVVPEVIRRRRAVIEEIFCTELESLLGKLEPTGTFEQPVASLSSRPPRAPGSELETLIQELVAEGMLEVRQWAPDARDGFFAQVESYRRLVTLLPSLGTELSMITYSG